MSGQDGAGVGVGRVSGDAMSPLQFQDELRRVARHDHRPRVDDALALAVQRVVANPALSQSRLLSRMLTALTYERGEFRRAEASAFDTATLALVISLMDVACAGTTGRDDWIKAVTTCDDAE